MHSSITEFLKNCFILNTDRDPAKGWAQLNDDIPSSDLNKIFLGEKKIQELNFHMVDNQKTADLLAATFPLHLISLKFERVLQGVNFSGWGTYSVRLKTKRGEVLPYKGLVVIGRIGPIIYDKLPIVERPNIDGSKMMKVKKGYYFDVDSWDGSDFFVPQETTQLFVTARVKEEIEKHRLTNVIFKSPLEEEHLWWPDKAKDLKK